MLRDFLGNNLRGARILNGYTQKELGDLVGNVSKQFIQKLESEDKKPNEDMIIALSDALNVEPQFFSSNMFKSLVSSEECYFRKLASTTLFTQQKTLYIASVFKFILKYFETIIEFPDYNISKIDSNSNCDAEFIERAAETCRKKWGLGIDTPIDNMVWLLENNGIIVTQMKDISDKVDAFLLESERPIIFLNYNKSAVRIRFDLAHELGHLILHRDSEISPEIETEAHRFASAFLLPRAAFLKEFSFLNSSNRISWSMLCEMKKRWKVSLSAMIRRAYELNIIDGIMYRNANIYLRKSGQTKEEKLDDIIQKETPSIIKDSLDQFNDQELLQILMMTNLKPSLLNKVIDYNISLGDEYIRPTNLLYI